MITVNGWCAGGMGGGYGNGEMNVQSTAEMGKDVCPNFLPLFLENIDRSSCNDGNWDHYHEDLSFNIIGGFTTVSRGKELITCLNP